MGEHAGDGPLLGAVALGWARNLDREQMAAFGYFAGLVRDLERVRGEVPRGRTDVATVEPDVTVVEDAVKREESPVAGGEGAPVERPPVQHRPVAVREGNRGLPVTGDRHLGPIRVRDRRIGEAPGQVAVGGVHPPHAGEISWRRRRTGLGHSRRLRTGRPGPGRRGWEWLRAWIVCGHEPTSDPR